jgi:50S ribosomal subunit-associated GTPase HflX
VVCDVTRKETLESTREWSSSLFQVAKAVPLIFLANKSDMIEQAEFKPTDLEVVARQFNAEYLYTSAKSGANVERAFERLGQLMVYQSIRR